MRFSYALAAVAASIGIAHADLREDINADFDHLETLYKHLHSNPELSFKESKTSAKLASEMRDLGFAVTEGIGDAWVKATAQQDQGTIVEGVGGYGVVAVMENGEGPTVLIRADMDALPVHERTGKPYASEVVDVSWSGVESNVMHACGHDIHMTSWIGTARRLAAMKDEWSGTLVMILQPAEELGKGSKSMLEDGLFERFPLPDYNLALHVSGTVAAGKVSYVPGFAMANVDSVDIIVKGVGGHGAYPHATKDPILVGAHIVTALQTLVSRETNPQDAAVVTVGAFNAGAKHNIISDQAHLKLTVRSYEDSVRERLLTGIERIAKAQAEAFGAPEPEIIHASTYTPSLYNSPELTVRAMKAIAGAIGAENIEEDSAVMGGEDFARFGRTETKIPSLLFRVGASEPEAIENMRNGGLAPPSTHSPFFAPVYEPTIKTGVEAMTTVALDLFNGAE